MTDYTRHNRLELELITLRNKVAELEIELHMALLERDRARDIAVRLEQEIAHIPVIGEAR